MLVDILKNLSNRTKNNHNREWEEVGMGKKW